MPRRPRPPLLPTAPPTRWWSRTTIVEEVVADGTVEVEAEIEAEVEETDTEGTDAEEVEA